MKYQFYENLPAQAKLIREKVFVEEQGFENEFDKRDSACLHLVVFKDDKAVGCARMFDDHGQMTLGRIAVLKEARHLHIGSFILQTLELKAKELGYHEVVLSAQLRASDFYRKNGYIAYGDEYLGEHCPHVQMKKEIA